VIMATIQKRPSWYTDEDDTAWSKVKAAFRRDWDQTKHDFGGKAPDLNQQATDTIAQATGSKPIPPGNVPTPHPNKQRTVDPSIPETTDRYREEDEPAYRYGYAASRHLGDEWDDGIEADLRREWGDETEWERRRDAIRRGWTYGQMERHRTLPR